jgi:MinD superfamily P-loop ATPase
MAYRITADCTACGICLNKCANGAVYVTEKEMYAIDPCRCTECIDLPRRNCNLICAVGAIQLDPEQRESPEELWAKQRAHKSARVHA